MSGGNGKTLKITNATLTAANSNTKRVVDAASSSNWNVVIDDCNCISAIDKWSYPAVVYGTQTDKLSVTVQNCEKISGWGYVVAFSQAAKSLTFDNCMEITDCVYFASAGKCGTIVAKDVDFTGAVGIQVRNANEGHSMYLENATIDVNYNGQHPVRVTLSNGDVAYPYTVTINDCEFYFNSVKYTDNSWLFAVSDVVTLVDETPALPDVVKVGETGYKTLAEAITNATAGSTITLLADINEDVTVDKKLTIDGANFNYTGTMTLNAGLTVTVTNVNFVNGGIAKTTKTSTGYYTVTNCTFNGNGTYA